MSAASPVMIQSLATVRESVREALQAAGAALAAGGNDAAANAQGFWRSAHAAMQVVNHRALLQFSGELGALISPAPAGADTAQTAAFTIGVESLLACMNALIAGQRDQPMRLWLAYEAMQRARGVKQPNQGELFFPDLTAGPGDNPAATALNADELRGARRVLEAGLLQWLRKGDIAGLKQVAAAIRRVEGSLSKGDERRLWWVARGVLEAVQQGVLAADTPVRRLVTQLNLQLGRLVQGPVQAPDTLLCDALLLAARAQPQADTPLLSGVLSEVRRVYGLQGILDVDKTPAPSGFSGEAVAAARQHADGLQVLWSSCAAGAGSLVEFEQRARALAGACEALGEPALNTLVVQLADAARQFTQSGAKLNDVTALEVACALLLMEPVLADDHAPGAEFAQRAQNMAARVKVSLDAPQALGAMPSAQLLSEQSLQKQTAQYKALVYGETGRSLRDIEMTLEGWFRDTRNPAAIAGLDKPFRQAVGALAVLGDAEAVLLAMTCRTDVARFAQGAPCAAAEQRSLVASVAALSAFVEAAKLGPTKLVMPAVAVETVEAPVLDFAAEPVAPVAPSLPVMAEIPVAPALELPPVAPVVEAPAQVVVPQESVAVDGAGDTDPEMLEIFLEEAGEVLTTIADTTPQSRANPQDQELLTTLRRAFHTLKGSGRMVGLKHIGDAAYAMEQVFNELSAEQRPGTPDLYQVVEHAHGDFTRWISELREHKQARVNASQLIVFTEKLRAGAALPATDTVVAIPAEAIAQPAAAQPVISDTVQVGDVSVSRTLYEIMLPEARDNASVLEAQNQRVQNGVKIDLEFLRAAHTLSGISGTAGFGAIRALGASLERVLQSAMDHDTAPHAEARKLIARAVNALVAQVASIAVPQAPDTHDDLIQALDGVKISVPEVVLPSVEPVIAAVPVVDAVVEPATALPHSSDNSGLTQLMTSPAEGGGIGRREYRLKDDIDPQLLQIFLEEAAELVPQVGQDLRDWRARPDDKLVPQSLKRLLHTLKGSSRMAGAMALGQLTHSMESRIENAELLPLIPPQLFDDLETSFDRIGTLIGHLQGVETVAPTGEAAPLTAAMDEMSRTMHMAAATGNMTQSLLMQTAVAPVDTGATDSAAAQPAASVQRPLIRVRADLIDRLANQAGEVSIARARVSAELRSARGSLRDLTENIGRLRAQLRELEIAAETQMQSRFTPQPESTGEKFDPLEFDRFTRLQELTRLMAESVNDVATVQHNLARDLDEGEKALASQAQITRDVQQDLMAIRMVPFASISDRLFRVARLSAKDNDKHVTLDISGGHVEVDRGVIERIAAPIEHLLRNAIVHGIEAPQPRIDAGKPEAGTLRLEVRQEGNEVVLTLADDGAGLNIARIREKAIGLGLMRENERLTDQQIGNFIFRSGFSTAGAVTTDAGRGVGMDVVMSEITALSGRVGTAFQRGKGTTFTIHLPLTLSVLQAVVLRLGSNYYGVPTMMVEQVQRLKADVLSAALNVQQIVWQDKQYPFHHLATLLEAGSGVEDGVAPPYGSVVLLRSGAHRAAIQVDDIVGGQEIVIKNIGAQLARVPGVTGAAVLGSGETVLILNPVVLSLRRIEAESNNAHEPAAPVDVTAEPERQRSVLVVDDSLTVREITGRLLTREGYIVLVAKDGVEALEKMRDQVPDVMITDVEMPRMDGFDLTRSVRAEESLKGLPIIMITSRTAEKHRQHASELGVDVFLGKPYEESELLGHIAALARRPLSA